MQRIKTSIAGCFKVVCLGILLTHTVPAFAEPSAIEVEWIDELWKDHLLWRSDLLAANQNNVYAETFCRDVFSLDQGDLKSLGTLAGVYAAKGEEAMLAMTSLLGLELYPVESYFKHTLEKADERIMGRPLAPSEEELAVRTNKFTTYLVEAVRTREIDRNLLVSEVALRALLIDYPQNLNVLQELSLTYRLSEEWTMSAMVNLYAMRAYPENRTFLYNYLESLRLIGRADVGWERIVDEVENMPEENELVELAVMLAEGAGRQDELQGLVQGSLKDGYTQERMLEIGRSLISKGQLNAAARALEMAHAIDESKYEPVYDLAVVNSVMMQGRKSVSWLKKLRTMVDPGKFNKMVSEGPFPPNVIEIMESDEAANL